MIQQAKIKHRELIETLEKIENSTASKLEKIQQCYREVNASLGQLKLLQKQYPLSDLKDEIQYFKYVLPSFIERLIFYTEMTRIESTRPPCNNGIEEAFTSKTLEMLNSFFQRHSFLYHYYRMGGTEFDHKLFLSGSVDLDFYPEIGLLLDSQFCTTGAYVFGRFQAYERLIEYMQQPDEFMSHSSDWPEVTWTESKAALTELIYALHAQGAIDQGRCSLNDMVSLFGRVFHIQPGNIYRCYYDLCLRKKNRTPFMDALREALKKRLEDSIK